MTITFLGVQIIILQSALGTSQVTAPQKQGYIQRKMNFAHRKIASSSTEVPSCTKDCSGPSLCTNKNDANSVNDYALTKLILRNDNVLQYRYLKTSRTLVP